MGQGNITPEANIDALRERTKVAKDRVTETTEKLKGVENLISSTMDDIKRMELVLTAAKQKQTYMKKIQEECVVEVHAVSVE